MKNENQAIHIKTDKEVVRVINEEYQTRKVHDWNPRRYDIESMESLIQLVRAKGTPDKTVMGYTLNQVQTIFDDTIENRPLDKATYNFSHADELIDWRGIFGKRINQKELIDFLKRREDEEVENREQLIANAQKLKLVTKVIGDYTYDDNNNVSFFFESKDGEGAVMLPSTIYVTIPILNESTYSATMEVEVELIKPKSEDEKPQIIFKCPKLKKHIKDAVKHEIDIMKKELPEYLILAGSIF